MLRLLGISFSALQSIFNEYAIHIDSFIMPLAYRNYMESDVMRIDFEEGLLAEQFFKLGGEFIDEANISLTSKELSLKAVDPQQISFISIRVPRIVFKRFEVNEARKIGLDFDQFNNEVNKLRGKPLSLVLKTPEYLEVEINNLVTKKIATLDISDSELPNPSIEYDAKVEIDKTALLEIIKEMKKTKSSVVIKANKKGIYFEALSTVKSKEGLEKSDKRLRRLDVKKAARAEFPTEFIYKLREFSRSLNLFGSSYQQLSNSD